MNDRRKVLSLVRVHGVPNLAHPRARRIDDVRPFIRQKLHLVHTRAERGQNNHLSALHSTEILSVARLLDKVHPHLAQPVVHRRVVNDFIRDPQLRLRELFPRLVRHLHRAFDAPAEPVRVRQLKRDPVLDVREPVLLHLRHQPSLAVRDPIVRHLRRRLFVVQELSAVLRRSSEVTAVLSRVERQIRRRVRARRRRASRRGRLDSRSIRARVGRATDRGGRGRR